MSESLVRVSVLAGRRRVDLCVPAEIPVIQVLPDLARGLGVAGGPDGAPRLVTVSGSALDPGQGLRAQGVADGEVLTLATAAEYHPPRVHDDLVEAVHERARHLFGSWSDRSSELAAQGVAGGVGLLGAGVLALSVHAGSVNAGPVSEWLLVTCLGAAVVSGLLAIGLARAAHDVEHVGAAWLAALYWGIAGIQVAEHFGAADHRLLAGAVGSAFISGLSLAVTRTHWPLLVPPLVVITALVLSGVIAELLRVDPWKVVLAGVAVGVVLARLLPGAVVEATVVRGQELHSSGTLLDQGTESRPGARRRVTTATPSGVDVEALDRDLRVASSLVLAVGISGSVLMVALVPAAVRSGLPATGLLLVLCGLRLLRLRRERLVTHVVVGLVGSAATAAVVAVAVATQRPEWATHVAGLCVVGLLLASWVGRAPDALRRGWWGDMVETALTISVPTLLVLVWWSGWGG